LNQRFEKTFYDKLLIKTQDNLKLINERNKNVCFDKEEEPYSPNWVLANTRWEPIIEIEQIIIGYRNKKNFLELKKAIEEGFDKKNGFPITVKLSPLANTFWGL
jgi:hypothetical protein